MKLGGGRIISRSRLMPRNSKPSQKGGEVLMQRLCSVAES
jgi:hypothetical protein